MNKTVNKMMIVRNEKKVKNFKPLRGPSRYTQTLGQPIEHIRNFKDYAGRHPKLRIIMRVFSNIFNDFVIFATHISYRNAKLIYRAASFENVVIYCFETPLLKTPPFGYNQIRKFSKQGTRIRLRSRPPKKKKKLCERSSAKSSEISNLFLLTPN